jgi:hypothetical protein
MIYPIYQIKTDTYTFLLHWASSGWSPRGTLCVWNLSSTIRRADPAARGRRDAGEACASGRVRRAYPVDFGHCDGRPHGSSPAVNMLPLSAAVLNHLVEAVAGHLLEPAACP